MHLEHNVHAVLIEKPDRVGDPVEVRLVDLPADRLELGPVDSEANYGEPRPLHQDCILFVQRRRRVIRVGDQGIVIEAAEEHASAHGVDDLSLLGAQPGELRVARGSVRRGDGCGQAGRGSEGKDGPHHDHHQERQPEGAKNAESAAT